MKPFLWSKIKLSWWAIIRVHCAVLGGRHVIKEVLKKIIAVAESYPDLKTDKTYIKSMAAVKQYENMLHTSRLIYNNSVTKLNRAIRIFPLSMLAGILGYSKRSYLEEGDDRS